MKVPRERNERAPRQVGARTADRRYLSRKDVKKLCDTGEIAVAADPKGGRARFIWRGQEYLAVRSDWELRISTADGQPVASRYY